MKSLFRPFPVPLTGKQWFYLGVLQGVGAGFIDGGANFGIAYAMYHNQDVVKMWIFSQNTIAGDLGVTPIIQCLASMLITSTLVHTDLHNKAIAPLPFVYPHVENLPDPRSLFSKATSRSDSEKTIPKASDDSMSTLTDRKKGFTYYYWMLIRFIFEGTEKNMLLEKVGLWPWLARFLWTAAQGAAIGILFGFPIWCLAIIILGPIYKMDNMGNKWAPEVIKCVYGAIVGWVTNPVIAVLALGSQAEHHLLVVPADEESGRLGPQSPITGVERISEEQEETLVEQSSRSQSPTPKTHLQPPNQLPTPDRKSHRLPPASPTISLRPPLTTNVSHLSPLPTPIPQTAPPQGSFYSNNAIGSASGSRPRGDSNGSFTYSLGGTGGRAQRSRAGSRASMPTFSGEIESGGVGGSGSLFIPGASGVGTRGRSGSEYGLRVPPLGSALGDASGKGGRIRAGSTPTQPIDTGEREGTGNTDVGVSLSPPTWDVFGRRESAPNMRKE